MRSSGKRTLGEQNEAYINLTTFTFINGLQ